MPTRPPHNCEHPACSRLAMSGRTCSQHKKERKQIKERARVNPYRSMYSRRWRRARKQFLLINSLCVHCLQENKITPATEVDHIIDHKGDPELFWDINNWQGLCKPCHSRKTAKENSLGGGGIKTPQPS